MQYFIDNFRISWEYFPMINSSESQNEDLGGQHADR